MVIVFVEKKFDEPKKREKRFPQLSRGYNSGMEYINYGMEYMEKKSCFVQINKIRMCREE
jgi:hypothetical protein